MRAIASLVVAGMAAGAMLCTNTVLASSSGAAGAAMALGAVGQTTGGSTRTANRFPLLPFSRQEASQRDAAPPADPFAGRSRESSFVAAPAGRGQTALEKGRAALAQGDTIVALGWYKQAVAANQRYAPGEYTPEHLAEELRRAGVDPQTGAVGARGTASPLAMRPSDAEGADGQFVPAALPQDVATRRGPYGAGGPANPYSQNNDLGLAPQRGGQFELDGPISRLPAAEGGAEKKSELLRLMSLARLALDRGDLAGARRMAEQADQLGVPDSSLAANEAPWVLLMEVERAERLRGGVRTASGAAAEPGQGSVERSVYNPATDRTRNMPANAQDDPSNQAAAAGDGAGLYDLGIQALEQGQRDMALRYFREAWQFQDQLDPQVRQNLKNQLNRLHAEAAASRPGQEPAALDEAAARQQVLQQQVARDITATQANVDKLAAKDPKGALGELQKLRERVGQAELDPTIRKRFLTMVDTRIGELEGFIAQNRHDIEQREQNDSVRDAVRQDRQQKIEVQEEVAKAVDEFNKLVGERRFAEAEVVAKRAHELAPNEPTVQTLVWKSKFIRWFEANNGHIEDYQEGLLTALDNVQKSSVPFDDNNPYIFGDMKDWDRLTLSRRKLVESQSTRLSPAELEIQNRLKKEVEVRFTERPLSEVIQTLGEMAGVNTYLDPNGLRMEGVMSDIPVTINLTQPISLQSALNLILEPLRLSYVIQNEVLRITSEQRRDSEVFVETYQVADLVIPIPNFPASYNIGLPSAIRDAYHSQWSGYGSGGMGSPSPLMLTSSDAAAPAGAGVVAQMRSAGLLSSSGQGRPPIPQTMGPGGMGGGVGADFDSLIELITSTIAPETWEEVGGPGAIQGFETNLSLVVSQTQEIHEQIADLLEQLRRLQDLQVTIEVRFITLNDDFFERIGVDFDFQIQDRSGRDPDNPFKENAPSAVVGLGPDGNPTADLDVQFTQGSFQSAIPQFGGFDANTAANFGFAILSDIEVFFLLQAAQGDNRTNVLQAPKVTLFNGQIATITDTVQRPFVTSIIPVVGDFAAAYQPVIVVLSEGTSLSVQAVVSNDRRFVRLTLVPMFSKIGDVEEFTFYGKKTTNSGSSVQDPTDENSTNRDGEIESTEGTTVQLPTVAITSVATTVSVPDGGTVLLGGIKRLSEGRSERGVPLLSKLPYINRIFRNVGIGRETSSLMLMVTPRIIIQEEEEEKAVGRALE